LVAITTSSRRPANARPMIRSLWPAPYESAVSMKVMPSSTARRSAATDSSSFTSPQPTAVPSAA